MQPEVDVTAGPVGAWVRPAEAAAALGVTERTVRNMVSRGELERAEIDGRAYVRRPVGTAESVSAPSESAFRGEAFRKVSGTEGAESADPAALVVAELRRLADGMAQAAADRAEALTLAAVAARDAERATAERNDARELADRERRAALEARDLADLYRARAERAARLAGTLARLPWYALAERRRLRDELVVLEAERARLVG